MSKYFKWAELPPRKDVYVYEGTTEWGNHDLYPIPKKERTYGTLAYYSYYITGGVSINSFTMGSSYVASGLSVWATIGGILLGSVIAGLNSFLGGQAGIDKSLGYVSPKPFQSSYRDTKTKADDDDQGNFWALGLLHPFVCFNGGERHLCMHYKNPSVA